VDTVEKELELRGPVRKNRWRTKEERRAIVEETMLPGASVARVARRHEVNANQVFGWRKLYREGRLETARFLPVKLANQDVLVKKDDAPGSGAIEIQLSKGTLRIFGSADVTTLRAAIECLI
jgi:transposase